MMKSTLLSAVTKLGLFLGSVGLGMLAYLLAGGMGSESDATSPSSAAPGPVAITREIVLDAETHLIARTEAPVDAAGDALGVVYILDQNGKVVRVTPTVGGGTEANSYAALADHATDPVLGFSGLALHPQFLLRDEPGYGRFYVIVSERAGAGEADFSPEFGSGEHHQDVLYEYTVEDPLLAEFRGERREVIRFRQPGAENNLRGLVFDLSGLLYLGVGDGAAAEPGRNSPSRNASSLTNAYGKVLRIDPLGRDSRNGRYGVPEGNPFRLVTDALPELWAFGLRAPHSLSFDPFRRDLCIAERGSSQREEINFSRSGGEHFGWDIAEDPANLGRAARARLAEIVTAPAIELDLRDGIFAPTAGSLVYRGEQFPSLAGAILFAGHDGRLLAVRNGANSAPATRNVARIDLGTRGDERFTALRQGPRGELLLLCEDGRVFEMRKGVGLGTGTTQKRTLYCETAPPREDRG